ncbi:MAG: amidohydrolase [Chloroflexota bacterium]|nr:MAG: amidohydrolase [Chloroflexota bacterium]
MDASLVLHNGKVYTVDEARPRVSAVAIAGGFVVAVGDDEQMLALAGPETEVIDLAGRLALPGLCDAHIHFYYWSLARKLAPVAGSPSREEMLARVWRWMESAPAGAWIAGWGWNENSWPDSSLPTRHDLDEITGSERPALLWRVDMHAAVANSAALRAAGIERGTPDPAGGLIGRDAAGRPDGMLWELAINLVADKMPDPDPDILAAALESGTAELHRLGVTAVHDQRMKDHYDGPVALAAYQALNRAGRLALRLNCNVAAHDLEHIESLGLASGFGDDYLRLGHVKLFTDGSMGSKTAWMLAPYEPGLDGDRTNTGVSVTPPEQMAAEFRRAAEASFPVSVHAIGDRANRVVLDIFEELGQSAPQPPIPHRIEHVQILDPADAPRLAAMGITASVQPVHAIDDMETAERVLGERAAHVYNFHTLAQSGALLALGSDAPVADPSPFLGIHAAVCRQRPEQMEAGPWYGAEALSLEQSIYGYTLGAAQAAGWQETIGSISPGKRADIAVLDRDLFAIVDAGVKDRELADTRVVMTIFDGRVVYAAAGD